jgi:DNA-directed RNA polymerase subunit RPC12/RpoP
LKFDLKNKFKNENKSDETTQNPSSEKEANLKAGMISSILKGGVTGEEDRTVTFADLNAVEEELQPKTVKEPTSEESVSLEAKLQQQLLSKLETQQLTTLVAKKPLTQKSLKTISPESEKISKLISVIESSQEKMIIPSISMDQGKITYPILTQIGEDEDNLDFLEKLASANFDILERFVSERLLVCNEHPESMSTSLRINCPHCGSIDISKLHLIEHRRCGYISENKNFDVSSNGKIAQCPSCKKQIKDQKKEIARPAMWYNCNECKDKFDDVSLKVHCRKFNHDIEVSDAQSLLIPGFKIKNLADTSNASISPILNSLKNLLGSFGFSAEENYTVSGKSGNNYRINIFGEDEQKRTVFIYIKNPNAESDNSELNSKIIEVLDTSPTVTILIGFPSISEKAKTITGNYNISLITEKEPNKILSSIKDILETKVPKTEV